MTAGPWRTGEDPRAFAERLSHELRTPLNGIQAWAHLLEEHLPPGDEFARRALEGIRLGVEQQVRILDALVASAKDG